MPPTRQFFAGVVAGVVVSVVVGAAVVSEGFGFLGGYFQAGLTSKSAGVDGQAIRSATPGSQSEGTSRANAQIVHSATPASQSEGTKGWIQEDLLGKQAVLQGKLDGKSAMFSQGFWPVSMDRRKGLDLPRRKHHLFVDVGLFYGSPLVCFVEEFPNLAYIGFEAHPVNFGVSHYRMIKGGKVFENRKDDVKRRIRVLPLAVSNTSSMVDFKEAHAPSCGSILPSKKNAWWCAQTTTHLLVPAVRMDLIFDMLPPSYNFTFMKIDAEGADLMAADGAGSYLRRFAIVAIECSVHLDRREAPCTQSDAVLMFKGHGFTHSHCTDDDCFFAHSDADLKIGECLQGVAGVHVWEGQCKEYRNRCADVRRLLE